MSSPSHSDISKEEEEERGRYGGFSNWLQKERFVGLFPGSYAWVCRLDNLRTIVEEFIPEDTKCLSFYESSNLADSSSSGFDSDTSVHSVPQRSWYRVPQSAVASVDGRAANSMFTTQFVTGLKKPTASEPLKSEPVNVEEAVNPFRHYYDNHCFLPAASHEELKLLRIDCVSGYVVAYYSQDSVESPFQNLAVSMAIYTLNNRSYSYVR